jgi:hypothetical protein
VNYPIYGKDIFHIKQRLLCIYDKRPKKRFNALLAESQRNAWILPVFSARRMLTLIPPVCEVYLFPTDCDLFVATSLRLVNTLAT